MTTRPDDRRPGQQELATDAPSPPRPSADSELTWLLHRAAQRLRNVTGDEAARHGLQLRDYIVLSALDRSHGLTQAELARELSLDKTTLMHQLDSLEERGLLERRTAPGDRRLRIPVCTAAGVKLCAEVTEACVAAEAAITRALPAATIRHLRTALVEIIGDYEDKGSCI